MDESRRIKYRLHVFLLSHTDATREYLCDIPQAGVGTMDTNACTGRRITHKGDHQLALKRRKQEHVCTVKIGLAGDEQGVT
jgi:hypothetical protein